MATPMQTALPRWMAASCALAVTAAIAALSPPWQVFCDEGYKIVDRGYDSAGSAPVMLLATAALFATVAAIRPGRRTWMAAGCVAIGAVILAGALELVWVLVHVLTYATHAQPAMPFHAAAMMIALVTGALVLVRALRLPQP